MISTCLRSPWPPKSLSLVAELTLQPGYSGPQSSALSLCYVVSSHAANRHVFSKTKTEREKERERESESKSYLNSAGNSACYSTQEGT